MKYLCYGLIFLAGVWVQWIWSTYLSFWGLAPQVLLVLTVALASREGPVLAISFAFAWGLCNDVARIHLFGVEALLLTCVAYGVGLVRHQIDLSSLLPQVVLLAAISYVYFPASAAVGLVFEGHAFWAGWREFFLTPIFNCIVAPGVFLFVERFAQKYDF